jgi:hypothetical protein
MHSAPRLIGAAERRDNSASETRASAFTPRPLTPHCCTLARSKFPPLAAAGGGVYLCVHDGDEGGNPAPLRSARRSHGRSRCRCRRSRRRTKPPPPPKPLPPSPPPPAAAPAAEAAAASAVASVAAEAAAAEASPPPNPSPSPRRRPRRRHRCRLRPGGPGNNISGAGGPKPPGIICYNNQQGTAKISSKWALCLLDTPHALPEDTYPNRCRLGYVRVCPAGMYPGHPHFNI